MLWAGAESSSLRSAARCPGATGAVRRGMHLRAATAAIVSVTCWSREAMTMMGVWGSVRCHRHRRVRLVRGERRGVSD
jgi:hypothetical protein